MTLADINTKITQMTSMDTTSNGYPNATRVIDINSWQHKIVSTMIYGSQDESDFDDQRRTSYPIKTTPLVALQRDYSIPVSEKVVAIKRVDISWDGGATWKRATPIDSNEIEMGMGRSSDTASENDLDGLFSKDQPRYDVKYNSIFLYPRPTQADVDAGALLRVEWQTEMQEYTTSDLTTGTIVPGFDSAFHMMLALGPSLDVAIAYNLPNKKDIASMLQDYEVRLNRVYGMKQKDRDISVRPYWESYK